MKTNSSLAALVLSALFVAGVAPPRPVSAQAQACDVVVTGTNTEPADATAVSLAVNGPLPAVATVCLDGAGPPFQFGVASFVAIDPMPGVQELTIIGLNGAKIRGGIQPFRFVPTSVLPRLRIKNLYFEEPSFSAVSIFRANEYLEISGLEVDRVFSVFVPAFGVSIREGIALSTFQAEIAGEILIANNSINGGDYNNVADFQGVYAGIGLFGQFGALNPNPLSATVEVSNNVVTNWAGSAISVLNVDGATIKGNSIAPGTFGSFIGGSACAVPTGIGSAAGISLAGVTNSVVESNTIVLEPALDGAGNAPCTAGLLLLGDNGLGIGDSTGNLIKANIVSGDGSYAIIVGTDDTAAEEDNLFLGNNVATFAPSAASLSLGPDANDNTFKGRFPTLDGNVAGNSVTGH